MGNRCLSTGWQLDDEPPLQCKICNGEGKVPGTFWGTNPCDRCNGSGKLLPSGQAATAKPDGDNEGWSTGSKVAAGVVGVGALAAAGYGISQMLRRRLNPSPGHLITMPPSRPYPNRAKSPADQ